jgi:hypothetical protein
VKAALGRRAAGEAIGTELLMAVIVGSGTQATELSHDVGPLRPQQPPDSLPPPPSRTHRFPTD